jgi:hypothetical protein
VAVAYNAYVSDVLRLVYFHGSLVQRGDRITNEIVEAGVGILSGAAETLAYAERRV